MQSYDFFAICERFERIQLNKERFFGAIWLFFAIFLLPLYRVPPKEHNGLYKIFFKISKSNLFEKMDCSFFYAQMLVKAQINYDYPQNVL